MEVEEEEQEEEERKRCEEMNPVEDETPLSQPPVTSLNEVT